MPKKISPNNGVSKKPPCHWATRPLAENEPTFTFLARDPAAALAIAYWAELRIAAGLNHRNDAQMQDAIQVCSEFAEFLRGQPDSKKEQLARVLKIDAAVALRCAMGM